MKSPVIIDNNDLRGLISFKSCSKLDKKKLNSRLNSLVKLAQPGLKINELKTEKYTNKRASCENHWRDSKLLGSLWIHKITLKEEKYLQ